MVLTLALLEGLLLAVVGWSMIVFWSHTILATWIDVALLIVKGLALSACCIVSFYYNDLYDFRIVRNLGDFAARLLQSVGVAFILLAAFYTIFPKANIAGGPFVSSFLIIIGLLLPVRFISYMVMRSRPFIERVLILGRSPLSYKIIDELEAQPNVGYSVVGVVDDTLPAGDSPSPYPVLGSIHELPRILEQIRPDRIIVTLTERRGRLPVGHLLEARTRQILVEDGTDMYEQLTGKLAIEALTPSSLIFSRDFLKSRFDLAVGRAMSFLTSVVGLVTLAPLIALISLTIKLDSRGPVFFVQKRIGLGGTRFRLIKFRTMHPVTAQPSEWVRDNSDRVTRAGKWLRKFRLDEIPQFVNILFGDMNLVGPRPHPVSNFDLFIQKIPYYALRGGVRPGVTGWAQVRYGYANDLSEETEKMRYDLYYIKHLSLWLDLRILFDTVKIVLFGRGAKAADAYHVRLLPKTDDENGRAGALRAAVHASDERLIPGVEVTRRRST